MKDKVVIITGANRGIGKEAAKEIAKLGAKVYMACRSVDLALKVREELIFETNNKNIFVKELDLSSASSVYKFAESFKSSEDQLDVLINNAGIMSQSKKLNDRGIELTFAVNVLGHHLLTRLIVELLKNSRQSRIINVASDYAGGLDLEDINFNKRNYDLTAAYKQSKQANRMLTREWARRLEKEKIPVYSLTPGFVPKTDLFREQTKGNKIVLNTFGLVGGRTVGQGADTIVWLASTDEIPGSNGGFFNLRKEEKCRFFNPADEKKLWDKCEEFLSKTNVDSKVPDLA
jgi:NAD(P)-dependent dehydrogenase (short-subunit alcohol dehydrogenase family)